MNPIVLRLLTACLALTCFGAATAKGPRLYEPEGTVTAYVKKTTSAQIYAPRDARAQKVFFPDPAQSLIYPGESLLRSFFDAHVEDFAKEGAARQALAFFSPRFDELVRTGRYMDAEIDKAACSLFSEAKPPCVVNGGLRGDFALDAKRAVRVVSGRTSGSDEFVQAWTCALLNLKPKDAADASGATAKSKADDAEATADRTTDRTLGVCDRFGWLPPPGNDPSWLAKATFGDVTQGLAVKRALRIAVDHQTTALTRAVEDILREREDLFRAAVDPKTAIEAFMKELDRWFEGDTQREVFGAADPEDRTLVATILTKSVVDESFPGITDPAKQAANRTAVRKLVRETASKVEGFEPQIATLAASRPFKDAIKDDDARRQAASKLLAKVLQAVGGDKRLLGSNDALSAVVDIRLAPRFNSADAYRRAQPKFEAFRVAMAAAVPYQDAKTSTFDNDDFGALLRVVMGQNRHLSVFANDLVAQFGTAIMDAVSQDARAAADYEYWWLTFYPKAVPIGTRDWKGTSVVQIDFPTAALPESQFRRWLLDYYTDPKTRMLNAIDEQLELMKYDPVGDTSLASFMLGQLRAELLKVIPSIDTLDADKPKKLRTSIEVSSAAICKERSFYEGKSKFTQAAGLVEQVERLAVLSDAGIGNTTQFGAGTVMMKRLYYHPFVQLEGQSGTCEAVAEATPKLSLEHPLSWYEQELLVFAELLRWGGLPKNVDVDFGDKNWARIGPDPKINSAALTRQNLRDDFGQTPKHLFLPDTPAAGTALLHPEFVHHLNGTVLDDEHEARKLFRYALAIRALARTTLYERTSSRIYYHLENQFGALNAKLLRRLKATGSFTTGATCAASPIAPQCLVSNGLVRMQKSIEAEGNSLYPGPVILPELKEDWSADESIQSMMLLIEAILAPDAGARLQRAKTHSSSVVATWLDKARGCLQANPPLSDGCKPYFLAGPAGHETLRASVLDDLSTEERTRITAELLEKRLVGLWKGLTYICRIDRAVTYQDMSTLKAYDDFVSVGKPHIQRNVEVMNMLPSSRDDLVAQSTLEGGSLMKFALAARGEASAGTVNTHGHSHSGSDSSKTKDDGSNANVTALEEFARQFETILNYRLSGGASGQADAKASVSHAYAYSKSKEYLNAVVTAAGETDNFAKWIIRRGSKDTADPKHNGFPNGSIPFNLLVKVPRSAMLTDWDGSKHLLFNSGYTLQHRLSYYTTRYPFLYQVDKKKTARKQDTTLNTLGGLIRLDPTDRISFDDIREKLDEEANFVATARAAQQATLETLKKNLAENDALTQATKDLIPKTAAEKKAAEGEPKPATPPATGTTPPAAQEPPPANTPAGTGSH